MRAFAISYQWLEARRQGKGSRLDMADLSGMGLNIRILETLDWALAARSVASPKSFRRCYGPAYKSFAFPRA